MSSSNMQPRLPSFPLQIPPTCLECGWTLTDYTSQGTPSSELSGSPSSPSPARTVSLTGGGFFHVGPSSLTAGNPFGTSAVSPSAASTNTSGTPTLSRPFEIGTSAGFESTATGSTTQGDERPGTPEWLKDASEDLEASAGLCNNCQGLNLEARFHRAYDLYEGARRGQNTRKLEVYRSYEEGPPYLADFYYVAPLGDRLSRPSTCRLCSFLRKTIPDPEQGRYKILALCSTESYVFEAPQNDNKRGRRPWGLWNHNVFMAVFCKPKKPAAASLPGFRVINCTKSPPAVEVRPWAESYVALSYVWGPPSGDWPQTILDAVEVTKRLGEKYFKYLWVDRLGIDQSNAREKQFLISKMDAIYEGAEFTIIAASGDARTGLPGVGKTPRAEQPAVSLRKERRWPSDFGYYDEEGVYEDHQDEALKLLDITEEELLEASKDGEWFDPYRHGFRTRDRPDIVEMMKDLRLREKYDISDDQFRIFETFEQVVKLDGHIKAFISRNLSHGGDSYNAFLGVAARYSVDDGLSLVLGMPVWTGTLANGRQALHTTFVLSISTWAHEGELVYRGTKNSGIYVVNCARRDDFPSWTWVGWKGNVSFSKRAHAEEDDSTEPFGWSNGLHAGLFEAITDKGWVDQMHRGVWCADIAIDSSDGRHSLSLPSSSWASVRTIAVDQSRRWFLKIRNPLILPLEYLIESSMEGERKVELHSSVPITVEELEDDYHSGRVIAVLLLVAQSPRIFDGALRCILLRKVGNGGEEWERIGRLAVTIEEWAMNKLKRTPDFTAALPVDRFEEGIFTFNALATITEIYEIQLDVKDRRAS
ncbi:hypothetical protein C8A03DRAFT_33629 [Achaetomium macrosporum]|uniref:Heterokaryon incompatibility domain-containing protein n=1 Tax=Achaetomium macrosporum TaxID=79813 RepID=A0AAN7HB45_9PEZI|nr:hypothetical protein C8A03DRAFT_33629 [Achaetomium macrosporum]